MGGQALDSFDPVRDCLRAVLNKVMNTQTVMSNSLHNIYCSLFLHVLATGRGHLQPS
jgi:hypothetical protein